jgi:hypothetical protein
MKRFTVFEEPKNTMAETIRSKDTQPPRQLGDLGGFQHSKSKFGAGVVI